MGTPIPEPGPVDPVAPGELCDVCWGFDKEFGAVPTPSSITVEFDGIAKGPNWQPSDGDPPEGSFDLSQNLDFGPCFFTIRGDINVEVSFGLAITFVFGSKTGGFQFFSVQHDGICATVMSSTLNDHFTGGTATVTIPETG